MQNRNYYNSERDYDDWQNGGYRTSGYRDDREFRRDNDWREAENQDRVGNQYRGYDNGDLNRRNRERSDQDSRRFTGHDYDRSRSGYGGDKSRSAAGYGASNYPDRPSYGRNHRNYGNESNRGYGGGYYGGQQGWSDGPSYGDRDEYDQEDRGFLDKAGDEVMSWFGDEEAARRRNRDGHRGKGPKNYTRSDSGIEEDVNERLTDDLMVDASDISVSVSKGEITLDGTVDSKAAKRRAEDCCDSVSGTQHVQNNLRVDRDSGDRWDRKADTYSESSSTKSGKKTSA